MFNFGKALRFVAFSAVLGLLALAISAQAAPTIALSWGASTTTGVTYNVYRETSAGACTLTSTGTGPGCLLLNASPLTVLSYTDSAPPANATSFYVVRAFNSSGIGSTYSNEVSVNLVQPSPPGAVTCSLTVSSGSAALTCK